ncbi:hypothetical protein BJX61DRAFT_211298 [Aspergillus egyptiacus]|nr:hypothetical protein BJX61DRAFT_211298 [Aspergillus egyptiacus]
MHCAATFGPVMSGACGGGGGVTATATATTQNMRVSATAQTGAIPGCQGYQGCGGYERCGGHGHAYRACGQCQGRGCQGGCRGCGEGGGQEIRYCVSVGPANGGMAVHMGCGRGCKGQCYCRDRDRDRYAYGPPLPVVMDVARGGDCCLR